MAVGGENREFVTALVIIDFENVGQWAEKQRIPYTTFVDLSQRPQVYDLVRQTVEEVNESLPAAARVRRFEVAYHLLSPRQNLRIRVKTATDEDTPLGP